MTTPSMTSPRRPQAALRVLGGLCALGTVLLAPHAATAQGKLEAQYEATLAGIPVGKGGWNIDISEDQYSASAVGGTSVSMGLFTASSFSELAIREKSAELTTVSANLQVSPAGP